MIRARRRGDPPADIPVGHRPWPVPNRPWIIRMTWRDLLFAHWAVEPSIVRPHVPETLALDTRQGVAWLGVVPFDMTLRPRGLPPLGGPTRSLEVNLRTYVTTGGKPGVWFFSLDAERRLGVWGGRRFFHLPYFRADMSMETGGGSPDAAVPSSGGLIRYASERVGEGPAARFRAVYGPVEGGPARARDPLSRWLTERYCLYSADGGRTYRTEVHHRPWPLEEATATIEENTLGDPIGLPMAGPPPHARFSRRLEVVCWTPEEV